MLMPQNFESPWLWEWEDWTEANFKENIKELSFSLKWVAFSEEATSRNKLGLGLEMCGICLNNNKY